MSAPLSIQPCLLFQKGNPLGQIWLIRVTLKRIFVVGDRLGLRPLQFSRQFCASPFGGAVSPWDGSNGKLAKMTLTKVRKFLIILTVRIITTANAISATRYFSNDYSIPKEYQPV